MFVQPRNRNLAQAAFSTLALIYHQTVHNLRSSHSNAVVGLAMSVGQALAMVAGFYMMFHVMGVRRSPIRGDFMLYLMSGIFLIYFALHPIEEALGIS